MVDLVVVVPTRGRPSEAADLAETCRQMNAAATRLVFAIDENDPTITEYRDALAPYEDAVVHPVVRPRGHVRAINAGAAFALTLEPFAVAKLDDDHRPRTHGWDAAMLAVLREMGTGIVYGDDKLQGADLPTAPTMTTDIVWALGYMGPPELMHMYVDRFWLDLGERGGCLRYLPEVVIEHMHPIAGKSEWTPGHVRVNAPERLAADKEAYERYKEQRFEADVGKVAALIPDTKRLRAFLRPVRVR